MSSLTVVVPALNEEKNIDATVTSLVPLLEKVFDDYQILVFDDASRDRTGEIADSLAVKNRKVQVIHNPQTMGLGYNYKKGVELAKKDYIIMVPGDNEITIESLQTIFQHLGEKDIVVPYTNNMEVRPLYRRLLSKTYTWTNNLLFRTNLIYFNGPVVHKRELLQKIDIRTNSFAYQTEILVKMIHNGCSYVEVPIYIKERTLGKSNALRMKNIVRVFKSTLDLLKHIYFK